MNNNDLQPLLDLPSGEIMIESSYSYSERRLIGTGIHVESLIALALELQELRAVAEAAENVMKRSNVDVLAAMNPSAIYWTKELIAALEALRKG
jgi:hypothetical protein